MNKLTKQISTCIGTSLILAACSSYHPMEATYDKMSRFESKRALENKVPSIVSTPVKLHSRGPASSSRVHSKLSYTNKQLYFVTLYSQYMEIASYSTLGVEQVKTCPGLHSAWLTYKDHHSNLWPKKSITVSFDSDPKNWNQKHYSSYPELNLPITFDALRPTVADIIKTSSSKPQAVLQKGINTHVQKTYREIKQLCKDGISDNYYAYENLANDLSKQRTMTASKQNMDTLFKISIFSNMSILNSLKDKQSRGIASSQDNVLTNENVVRFKAPWIKDYFRSLKKYR